MLTIRQEQIDTMMQPQLNSITLSIGLELQQRYPLFFQYYTNEQLQAWVAKQINYLKRLNITGKSRTLIRLTIITSKNKSAAEKESKSLFEAGSKELKVLCTLMNEWSSRNEVAELGKDEL
jgi:hypothetical protein